MSTEETEMKATEQVTPETENVETAAAETENTADDADWDDIPEMEEENPIARTETETQTDEQDGSDERTRKTSDGAKPQENAGNDNIADDDGEGKDPYAFLYKEDADTANSTEDKENTESSEADVTDRPLSDNVTKDTDAANAGTNTLDNLKVDELISSLPDGDLKDFAENYPEETKMAAAMAVQVLKKLGFDKLRGDLAKYAGTAEEYSKNQAAMAAYAAQQEFEKAVLKIHPDANEIINGKDRTNFAGWLKNQPKFIQRRFRDCNDPEEAADILTRYKETRGIQKQAQQSRTAKIRGVKSSSAVAKRGADTDDADWDDVPEPDDF